MSSPQLTVVLPTHNPHVGRLQRTLAGLRNQSLPSVRWELLVIDNASDTPLSLPPDAPPQARIISEPQLGLSHARHRGFTEARGEFVVLVDDDNVLNADYLARVVDLFLQHPRIGVLGGKSLPEFATEPPAWMQEFHGLLALRDLGEQPLISNGLRARGRPEIHYPEFAPIGAGMALRRAAWTAWLQSPSHLAIGDRRGTALTSSGDNDIVLCALGAGWEVAYFPDLQLTHLIPAGRLEPAYLARLNRGVQASWVQVLARHGARPWPAVPAWTLPLRRWKNWLTYRAWTGPAAHIRWAGACGRLEGQANLTPS